MKPPASLISRPSSDSPDSDAENLAEQKETSITSSEPSPQEPIFPQDPFCRRGAASSGNGAERRAEIMDVFNVETFDPNKVRAWFAKEKERRDAHMRGDLELMYLMETKLHRDMKDEDDDDDYLDSDYEEEDYVRAFEAYVSDSESDDEDGDPLCPIICDFLCDLPRPSDQLWGMEITGKVLAAWGNCHQFECRCTRDYRFERVLRYAKDELPFSEDTVNIDVRGLYSEDVQKTLRKHLFRLSHQSPLSSKYLNVIVGCTMHGIGEGKLRQTVTDLLKVYKILKWSEGCKGAIISINLEDSLGWTACDFAEDYVADEKTDLGEEVESKEKLELCTVICDFLCDLPTDQRKDSGTIEKVQAALQRCDGGGCGVDKDTVAIDLRGLYSGDAETMLVERLNVLSGQSTIKYLDVAVGCIVHGLGKGNLWDAVTNVLLRDETIKWMGYDSGAVISIELDGRKDYSKLRSLVGR